jgi:hypothetical protein
MSMKKNELKMGKKKSKWFVVLSSTKLNIKEEDKNIKQIKKLNKHKKWNKCKIPWGRDTGGYWAPVCWYGRGATGSSKGLLTLTLSLIGGALPELIHRFLVLIGFVSIRFENAGKDFVFVFGFFFGNQKRKLK